MEMVFCQPGVHSTHSENHQLHICVLTRYFDMVKHMWECGDGALDSCIVSQRAIDGWERGHDLVRTKCETMGSQHRWHGYSDERKFTNLLQHLWLHAVLPPLEMGHFREQ